MADRRPYACPRCESLLTATQVKKIDEWLGSQTCRSCGKKELDLYTVKVLVLPSCERFFIDEAVFKTQWHHSTHLKNWHTAVLTSPDKPTVHLGTHAAAEARARDNKDRPIWEIRYRFVVKINKDATIDPEVHEDMDEWYESWELYPYDITRYVNRFETPGSVSLLANPNVLTVVRAFEREREP